MPEIRYKNRYKCGQLIEEIPYEVSDEQLAEEAEEREVAKVEALLEQGWDNKMAIKVLKIVVKRLLKKGILP